MSAAAWNSTDPPENESLGGGEATEAKQLSGISAKASAQDTLELLPSASPVRLWNLIYVKHESSSHPPLRAGLKKH